MTVTTDDNFGFERQELTEMADTIEKISEKITNSIINLSIIASSLNINLGNIRNVGIIINNKFVEFFHLFKSKGLVFRSSDNSKNNYNTLSFIGRIIEQELYKLYFNAASKYSAIESSLFNLYIDKANKINEYKSFNLIKVMILKLKDGDFEEKFDFFVSDEERKKINTLLDEYNDEVIKIFNYKIDEDIIDIIINKIMDSEDMGVLKPIYDETESSSLGFLKLVVIPELIKLGYPKIAEKLEKDWTEFGISDKENYHDFLPKTM